MFFDLLAYFLERREKAQGLAEYGMILCTASITAIVALFALAPKIEALFAVRSSLPGG